MGLFNKAKTSEKTKDALLKRGPLVLSKMSKHLTIGDLEAALIKEFPVNTAESWDRMGLLVGERALPVAGVAVALDATVPAIREAAAQGCNVLLSHHPAFIQPPDNFAPESSAALSSGAVVWAAIQYGVALMNVHTALDVSHAALYMLPTMLNLKPLGRVLEPIGADASVGYGEVCAVPEDGAAPETLAHLAARCTAVFGRAPRVWGDVDAPVQTAVCATGSAGELAGMCAKHGIDCLICGEVKYHSALDAAHAGVGIIELGHDVSELPLCALLADAATRAGVERHLIVLLEQAHNWCHPEATRV